MGSVSKERLWGATIAAAEQRAKELRLAADVAACEAWNFRLRGYGGPAQPSPVIGDALNAGFRYLEVKCDGCSTHSTVDLTIIRRPKETPVWQLERRMACRPCSELRGSPYKRGHLVRLRRSNSTTKNDSEPWYPGDQRESH
ncbi:hypothetical protein ACH79_20495 [Bradyrhizobium sp. CCBAU 051011]|uniref:hypothetical protein n=1 Tax=Bradyrhizobium sp. CCBAU 051011 TaxID=858422 RepID=UPI0013741690|nr:hypothetical protein [Bradyrhizobium sp. CCBAU 051011]QHO78958.1 hypothetical protein ACH79_20495 [Bradyrhizobium sp. CCBAU 051011]